MTQRDQTFTVTVHVTVTNPALAIKTARDRAEVSGCPRCEVRTARDAVQWLVDLPPGVCLDGIATIEKGA